MQNEIKVLVCTGMLIIGLLINGCSGTTGSDPDGDSVTLTGTFRSVKGVMDPLSCYCFNAGYLTLDNGEEIPVCLKEDGEAVSCSKVRVKGNYVTKKNQPEPASPCPAAEKRYFNAETLTCI